MLAVLAAVAIAFILPAVNNVKDALYQSETVERGSISTYYSFSGSLELRRQETLAAQTDCEVRDVYVAEGDQVAKDDRLMRLSDGRTLRAGIDGEVVSVDVEEDDLVTKMCIRDRGKPCLQPRSGLRRELRLLTRPRL